MRPWTLRDNLKSLWLRVGSELTLQIRLRMVLPHCSTDVLFFHLRRKSTQSTVGVAGGGDNVTVGKELVQI